MILVLFGGGVDFGVLVVVCWMAAVGWAAVEDEVEAAAGVGGAGAGVCWC